jgi:hypothetical protein
VKVSCPVQSKVIHSCLVLFAFFCDCCGFTFGNVETVDDCILELAQRFYSSAGIEECSEYSQDNVNLILRLCLAKMDLWLSLQN